MVAASSSMMSHAQEGDRKRKYTLERAKAHHLCRQLQMRLQYARLKVEHGWQRQSLNEVENLYFHHSHQRGPKPFQPNLVATTTQPEQTAFTAPSNPQSSLSFISRNSVATFASGSQSMPNGKKTHSRMGSGNPSPLSNSSVPITASESSAQMPPPPSTTPTPMAVDKTPSDATHQHVYPTLPTPTSPQRRPSLPHQLQSPANIRSSPRPPTGHSVASSSSSSSSTPRRPTPDTPMPAPRPHPSSLLMSPASPTKSRSRPVVKSHLAKPRPKHTNASTTNNAAGSTLSANYRSKESYNFGSSSGLTYDAFWSSHSTATNSPRNGASTIPSSASSRTSGMIGSSQMAMTAPSAGAGPSSLGQQAQV